MFYRLPGTIGPHGVSRKEGVQVTRIEHRISIFILLVYILKLSKSCYNYMT